MINTPPQKYTTSAAFVPLLTNTITTYLSPTPTDRILDLGCGDGLLSARIAATLDPTSNGHLLGLDASASMIRSASTAHASPTATFRVADCAALGAAALPDLLTPSSFDKVFSNAALHWILRAPATRTAVFADAFRLLKPGGALVFEMGGAGNIAEVQAALAAAMVTHGGVSDIEAAREACPWFFPDEAWVREVLGRVGFEVERVESEYRPTRLTEGEGGGLEGWVRLMGAGWLEGVDEGRREGVVRWVVEVLRGACRREDGGWWLGYVRLRAVARKPVGAE